MSLSDANRQAIEQCISKANKCLATGTKEGAARAVRLLEKAQRMDPARAGEIQPSIDDAKAAFSATAQPAPPQAAQSTPAPPQVDAQEAQAKARAEEERRQASAHQRAQNARAAQAEEERQQASAQSAQQQHAQQQHAHQQQRQRAQKSRAHSAADGAPHAPDPSADASSPQRPKGLLSHLLATMQAIFSAFGRFLQTILGFWMGPSKRGEGSVQGEDQERHESRRSTGSPRSRGHGGDTLTPRPAPNIPKDPASAIARLLQLHESDLYQIIGVSETATASEIKRNFRMQSLKVHPDKHDDANRPRAEAAFKRLSQAYEVLSDEDNRKNYDLEMIHRQNYHSNMEAEMEDFLKQMRENIELAKTRLKCDVCWDYHPKHIVKDKAMSEGRYCNRCRVSHRLNEGDVWKETTMFKYHIYGVFDGTVYDITEWGICHGLEKIPANSHHVVVTLREPEGKTKGRGKSKNKKKAASPPKQPVPETVEELMDFLMKQHQAENGAKNRQSKAPTGPKEKKARGKGRKGKKR